jgi:hypothetical protein
MKRVELESLEDLVILSSISPFGTTIQHYRDEVGDVYFMLSGTREENIIFYTRHERISHRYINLDLSKGTLQFTDTPIIDPKYKTTPIIEIKKQDLIEKTL